MTDRYGLMKTIIWILILVAMVLLIGLLAAIWERWEHKQSNQAEIKQAGIEWCEANYYDCSLAWRKDAEQADNALIECERRNAEFICNPDELEECEMSLTQCVGELTEIKGQRETMKQQVAQCCFGYVKVSK